MKIVRVLYEMMLISIILIPLLTQSVLASPFNFPDESSSSNKQRGGMVMPGIYFHEPPRSSKSLDNVEPEPRNKQKEGMVMPGIYFQLPRSGKTLGSQNNPPAAISFGPSEPVILPSLDSIRLSPPDNAPKEDAPKNNEVIFFGEGPGDADVNDNSETTDKSDSEVNNAVLFFDVPASGDNIDRGNDDLPVMDPVPAAFDVPVINNSSKFENSTKQTSEQGIPVIIIIDDMPIEGFLHFSNSTNYNQTVSSIGDLRDSSQNDSNRLDASSESPVLFFNHIEDEAMHDDGGITNFLFPTPKSTDFTVENDIPLDTLNTTNLNTCKSGNMLYNDSCYELLTSGPCGNGSWLISKNGFSAECEERKCAADEVLLNNSCVSNNKNVCNGRNLVVNQSGIGNCQCESGEILYQGECHYLLGQGPCGEDNWLIMKDLTNVVCAPRQCPLGQILYENRCVDPEDSTICASGQMLYIELTGDSYCDCDPDFIYIPHNGNCIPEYERGYCVWGEYLIWNEEEELECVKNPCGVDRHIYHNATERCYEKKYIGYCEQQLIRIEGEGAECDELDVKNIFEVPTLRRCPRGSARDVLHECRKRYRMPSRSSVLTSKHLHGGCPRGWTKGPNGRCKKIVNMFG